MVMIVDPVELADPILWRSFIAVCEARSFTAAARLLGLRQSAVSQHIARLERRCGRRLLARDTHGVALTPDGDALLPHAREVLAVGARIERYLSGVRLRGRVRFGASEDFVSGALADVLAGFARHHEGVDIELTVAMSGQLYPSFDAGELDLILTKRRGGDRRGRVAWTESLQWVARRGLTLDPASPLPLVLYPPPSITRSIAIGVLDAAGRPWRAACTSGSLSGIHAAVMAGLGVAAHAPRLLPPGLAALDRSTGLPPLGMVEFVMLGGDSAGTPAATLADAITAGIPRLRRIDSPV